jgi:hypothetical protein
MNVSVYGKEGCGKCAAAKDKLSLMGVPYETYDISRFTTLHDGWREDGSVGVLTASALWDTLPLFCVNGEFMDYPAAMKLLKARKEGKQIPTYRAAPNSAQEAVLV